MNPEDFDSFVSGFNFTSAAYSGGAGGTFANLVSGAPVGTVQGATPSFNTRNGLEGMLFTNSISQRILTPMLALHEATVILIAQPADGTETMFGGSYTAGTSFTMAVASNALQVTAPPATAALATGVAVTQPRVYAGAWHPEGGTLYAQIDAGTLASTGGGGKNARINWSTACFGGARTTYLSGWMARGLIFSRALPVRDLTGFNALIAAEVARIVI